MKAACMNNLKKLDDLAVQKLGKCHDLYAVAEDLKGSFVFQICEKKTSGGTKLEQILHPGKSLAAQRDPVVLRCAKTGVSECQ
jgi:hypothetical protein